MVNGMSSDNIFNNSDHYLDTIKRESKNAGEEPGSSKEIFKSGRKNESTSFDDQYFYIDLNAGHENSKGTSRSEASDDQYFYIDLNGYNDTKITSKINNPCKDYRAENNLNTMKQEIEKVDDKINPETFEDTRNTNTTRQKKTKHFEVFGSEVGNNQNPYLNLNTLNNGGMENTLLRVDTDYCIGLKALKQEILSEYDKGGNKQFNDFSNINSKKRQKKKKYSGAFCNQNVDTDMDILKYKKEISSSDADDYVKNLLETIKQELQQKIEGDRQLTDDGEFNNLYKKKKRKKKCEDNDNNINNSATETQYNMEALNLQRKIKKKKHKQMSNEYVCNNDSLLNKQEISSEIDDKFNINRIRKKNKKKKHKESCNDSNSDSVIDNQGISDKLDNKCDIDTTVPQRKKKKKRSLELSHDNVSNSDPLETNTVPKSNKKTNSCNAYNSDPVIINNEEFCDEMTVPKKKKNKEASDKNIHNYDPVTNKEISEDKIDNKCDIEEVTIQKKHKKKKKESSYQNTYDSDTKINNQKISDEIDSKYDIDAINLETKSKKRQNRLSNDILGNGDYVNSGENISDEIDIIHNIAEITPQRKNKKKKRKRLSNDNFFDNESVINNQEIPEETGNRYDTAEITQKNNKKKKRGWSNENDRDSYPAIKNGDISDESNKKCYVDTKNFKRPHKKKKKSISNENIGSEDSVITNSEIADEVDIKYNIEAINCQKKNKSKMRKLSNKNVYNGDPTIINHQGISIELYNNSDVEATNLQRKSKKKKKKENVNNNIPHHEISDEVDTNDLLSKTFSESKGKDAGLPKKAECIEGHEINKSSTYVEPFADDKLKNEPKTEFDQKWPEDFSQELDSGHQTDEGDLTIEVEKEAIKWQKLEKTHYFVPCPLHAMLTRTTYPTKEQMEAIRCQNLKIKNGPFTKEEDEKILNNLKNFCNENGLKMYPQLFISFPRCLRKHQKVEFLRYISQGLANRLIHRVHTRLKILLSKDTIKLGRFSAEEDSKILKFMKNSQSSRPFSELSKILGRTKNSIFQRYRRLVVANRVTVHWTPERIKPFLKNLLKITKCSNIKDLEYRQIKVKEWRKLSKKMDAIPIRKLQNAWENTIYPRLFVSKNVDLRKVKAQIIKRLIKRNETDWRAVNWKKITKKFPGFSPHKIYMMFKHLVIFLVPKEIQPNLKECLTFLNDKVLAFDGIPTTHHFKKIDFDV